MSKATYEPKQALSANPEKHTEAVYYKDATELAALIRTKQLSSREVVQAHLDRIGAVNPKVNAIVTLMAGDALRAASCRQGGEGWRSHRPAAWRAIHH